MKPEFLSSHFLTFSTSQLPNFYPLISVIIPVNPQSEFCNPQSKASAIRNRKLLIFSPS
ncbi:hypothetical protein D1AOALGA4SA_11121 [Olavius algarvensis Delta 1 endosymbiont]|nr:hypothetical protein D1AOALGA4SA_11121 [Olavius algarvensis Delta 1 endosymbiont]